jgi:hypothetical protein
MYVEITSTYTVEVIDYELNVETGYYEEVVG